eukprot:3100050-Rhodomonas_salina.1
MSRTSGSGDEYDSLAGSERSHPNQMLFQRHLQDRTNVQTKSKHVVSYEEASPAASLDFLSLASPPSLLPFITQLTSLAHSLPSSSLLLAACQTVRDVRQHLYFASVSTALVCPRVFTPSHFTSSPVRHLQHAARTSRTVFSCAATDNRKWMLSDFARASYGTNPNSTVFVLPCRRTSLAEAELELSFVLGDPLSRSVPTGAKVEAKVDAEDFCSKAAIGVHSSGNSRNQIRESTILARRVPRLWHDAFRDCPSAREAVRKAWDTTIV